MGLTGQCPISCENILKLCKTQSLNNCTLFKVDRNYIAQFCYPQNIVENAYSIYGILHGIQSHYFDLELRPSLLHTNKGTVAMISKRNRFSNSGFYITLSDSPLNSLDGKNTIFGQVTEGFETLERITESAVEKTQTPHQKINIKKTTVIEDPFPNMPGLREYVAYDANKSKLSTTNLIRVGSKPFKSFLHTKPMTGEIKRKEANNRADLLEIVGDLPDATVKPPKNVLFICKLNPITTEDSLELIFSQFGLVQYCDVIRDPKTGQSLNYGFIGFDCETSCERAYFKMNNVIIDERRVKVDFSQSVAYLWKHHHDLNSSLK